MGVDGLVGVGHGAMGDGMGSRCVDISVLNSLSVISWFSFINGRMNRRSKTDERQISKAAARRIACGRNVGEQEEFAWMLTVWNVSSMKMK